MSSMSKGIDIYIVYRFIKALSTPFEEMEAHKLGLIDKGGKKLKSAKSREEKDSMQPFDKLIINMKRMLAKVGLQSKTATFAAALLLLRETDLDVSNEEFIEMLMEVAREEGKEKELIEEIANSIGGSAAPSASPAGNIDIFDPILGKRGRKKRVGRAIDATSYIKRAMRKTVNESQEWWVTTGKKRYDRDTYYVKRGQLVLYGKINRGGTDTGKPYKGLNSALKHARRWKNAHGEEYHVVKFEKGELVSHDGQKRFKKYNK